MGNQLLIDSLTKDIIKEVDITQYSTKRKEHIKKVTGAPSDNIEAEDLTFINGMLRGITTFKRHNFQYYKVIKQGTTNEVYSLRIIQAINEPRSVKIVENM